MPRLNFLEMLHEIGFPRPGLVAIVAAMAVGCGQQEEFPPTKRTPPTPVLQSPPEAMPSVAQTNAPPDPTEAILRHRPLEKPENGYVKSEACRDCHKGQHASWHASYHRSMTQLATPETVLGDFNDQQFGFPNGAHYRLGQSDDHFWVEVSNHPQLKSRYGNGPLRLPIVMTTGSHNMQVYWFAIGNQRTLAILPMVHLRGEDRWIPRDAAFIKPPHGEHSLEPGRWNETCNTCHTTDPRPRRKGRTKIYDTEVSEFGIACESCHGPGEKHVAFHRLEETLRPAHAKDPIVNPETLDHVKSTQVCGSCHVFHRRIDPEGGYTPFKPGQDYEESRFALRMTDDVMAKLLEGIEDKDAARQSYSRQMLNQFWPDGSVRIAGREYNGMLESACHTKGEMSCITCHRLHQSTSDKRETKDWANDMLSTGMRTDQACLQCHQADDYATPRHTHHEPQSTGSQCLNCHMPHSTYGLLKAVRSHTIDSPLVRTDAKAGKPNACNLCHLDQTQEWTANHLNKWYGIEKPQLSPQQREVAAGPLWVLKGDAGMRALLAWHLSWQPALDASGSDWIPPYLSILMDDPYHAVRAITSRSLRKLPVYNEVNYDFMAPPIQRHQSGIEVFKRWKDTRSDPWKHQPPTLIDAAGNPLTNRFRVLLQNRDNRPVTLTE